MKLVISSGHGLKVRGASGYLDEVNEARRVVNRVAEMLKSVEVGVDTFHDDVSTSQNENLQRIVAYHNSRIRDLDVSVHFNAYQTTDKPMGTECLYVTQQTLAATVSRGISTVTGLPDRGAKKRTDLYFLNNTTMPAVLIEVCFVDSSADAKLYNDNFEAVCSAIAEGLTGIKLDQPPPTEPPVAEEIATVDITIHTAGKVKVVINGQPIDSSVTMTGALEPME